MGVWLRARESVRYAMVHSSPQNYAQTRLFARIVNRRFMKNNGG